MYFKKWLFTTCQYWPVVFVFFFFFSPSVERRRRDKINNWIVQLSKTIPDCTVDSTKTSQVSLISTQSQERYCGKMSAYSAWSVSFCLRFLSLHWVSFFSRVKVGSYQKPVTTFRSCAKAMLDYQRSWKHWRDWGWTTSSSDKRWRAPSLLLYKMGSHLIKFD